MNKDSSYKDRLEAIQYACDEIGADLVSAVRLSPHPDDWYLYYVICKRDRSPHERSYVTRNDRDRHERAYVIWLCNIGCEKPFLAEGNYDLTLAGALKLLTFRMGRTLGYDVKMTEEKTWPEEE